MRHLYSWIFFCREMGVVGGGGATFGGVCFHASKIWFAWRHQLFWDDICPKHGVRLYLNRQLGEKVNGGSLRALGPWQQKYYFSSYVLSILGQLNLLSSLHLRWRYIKWVFISWKRRETFETYHIIMAWSSGSNTGRRKSYLRSHAGSRIQFQLHE